MVGRTSETFGSVASWYHQGPTSFRLSAAVVLASSSAGPQMAAEFQIKEHIPGPGP